MGLRSVVLEDQNDVDIESADSEGSVSAAYLATLGLVERLHRLMLEVIRDEFDQAGIIEVTPVQALLLYNMGDAVLNPTDLRSKGYYQGSNVSYNLKKLIESGYLSHTKSKSDRRSVRIALTPRGHEIRARLDALFGRHVDTIRRNRMLSVSVNRESVAVLRQIERFWRDQVSSF